MPPEATTTAECPPETAFADLLAGRLAADDAAGLRRHVEGCDTCRDVLDALTTEAPAGSGTDDDIARELVRGGGPSAAGRTLDRRYALLRLLGRGGMGEVYEAEHLETGRRVAVKLIRGTLVA